jgi:hypothetical protein
MPFVSVGIRRESYLKLAAVFALYLLLAVIATFPLAFDANDRVFGLGTPPLNIWAMAWVDHQLPQDPIGLFDGNVFYPYPRTLAFSEHLFVPALLAVPVNRLTSNPVLAHNLVALLSLALAGLGMYLLCRELNLNTIPALAAGLIYAFHTWNINELIRIQILSNQWFPFLLFALLRFFKRPGWSTGLWVGSFYALQSLSCMYWALYLPYVTFPAVALMFWRTKLPTRKLVPLASGLVPALLLTGLFTVPYFLNKKDLGFRRTEMAPIPVARYLDVLPNNRLYENVLGTARPNENAAHFLGFAAMALAALGLFTGRGNSEKPLADQRSLLVVYVVAGFLLSLGPEIVVAGKSLGPGPYQILRNWAPGFENVRYPERWSLVLVLGFAPLVGNGLQFLQRFTGTAGAVVVAGLLFAEHLAAPLPLEPIPTGRQIPAVYPWLALQPDVRVVAEVPVATRYWGERSGADPMYFSTVHWKRTVQGFTGYFPPAYNYLRWRLFHFPAQESLDFLTKLGVDTIVVRAEEERPSWLDEPDPSWKLWKSFPEGHVVLRLTGATGLRYQPETRSARGLLELDRAAWKVHGSTPGAGRARDSDPTTSWSSGEFQKEHDFYAIRFPEPTVPARVSMRIGSPYEFPMQFQILGLIGNDQWVDLPFDRARVDDRFFAQLLHQPLNAWMDLDLRAPEVIEIRIRITKTDPYEMPWTMSEIRVFEKNP